MGESDQLSDQRTDSANGFTLNVRGKMGRTPNPAPFQLTFSRALDRLTGHMGYVGLRGSCMSKKADIWMPIYIGDYLKDTSHLDATRHGCYLLMLFHYWTKGPLTDNVDDLASVGHLRGPNAPSIVNSLLTEFFEKYTDGKWHQKRTDAERVKWAGKRLNAHEKAKIASRKRWKKNPSSNASGNPPSNAHAVLGLCPSSSPSSSQQIQTPLSPLPEAPPLVRPEDFANSWNHNRKNLPKLQAFPESRRNKILARIKQGLTLERFTEAVRLCTEKPFLRGDSKTRWQATFDWLVRNDRNIARVFEEEWDAEGSAVKLEFPEGVD